MGLLQILEAGIDGELLWLMVEDFNEFSVIVTNPLERLSLKRFVKKAHSSSALYSEQTSSVSYVKDKVLNT